MRVAFITLLLSLVPLAAVAAGSSTVTGYIGCHKLTLSGTQVSGSADFVVKNPADYLAITEVYPDVPQRTEYSYTVRANGADLYARSHKSLGFGRVTYFVRLPGGQGGRVTIRNSSKGRPALIESIRGVTRKRLDSLLAKDRFLLMGLIPPYAHGPAADELIAQLASNVETRPSLGIGKGFSYEIRYANAGADSVRAQLEACAKWANVHKMPAMLGLVSWWSGTPLQSDDGEGGRFGDIKYQQVCYSPNTEVPEHAELRKLVGDRYNAHYGLSVPNQWSSTPWLTMNSKRLNDYRFRRLDEAVEILKDVSPAGSSWISSIYLENEPRYWDTQCEAGNPKSTRGELWADFNPLAIADAKRDGVDLNPNDGLSNVELQWLFRNVGKYNQDTVDAVNKSVARHGLPPGLPVYTHSLQLREMFPGGAINHPASEWGYARRARTGLEGMWCQPSDFARVREWGPWANLNREENDGRHIDEHLWDLRVAYMTGSDLFNSYNWNAIGAQRVFDYMKEFLAGLPSVKLAPAEARFVDSATLRVKTPMKLQAFTRVGVPVEVVSDVKGTASLLVKGDDDQLFQSDALPVDLKKGKRTMAFDFATPAEARWSREAEVRLIVTGPRGRNAANAIRFTADSAAGARLVLDLRTQRALSLAVINR